MPPRIPWRRAQLQNCVELRTSATAPGFSISSFLLPCLHVQSRNASILSSLSDRPGAYNRRIRRGRGPASGKGGKSGRGSDGQKQHGKVPAGFNGGQTPDHIVHGKYGFKNLHATEMLPINLNRIQTLIDENRLDPSRLITVRDLYRTGALKRVRDGVKLLGDGAADLKAPIHIIVSQASQSAIAAVEAQGGTVTTRYYTKQAIQRIRYGQMHPYMSLRWDPEAIDNPALAPGKHSSSLEARASGLGYSYRLPDPTSRKDIEYYRDVKHRGYLSHTVEESEGPSLYFKPPLSDQAIEALKKRTGKSTKPGMSKEDNRLW